MSALKTKYKETQYTYNQHFVPLPEAKSEKIKPPVFDKNTPDNKELFKVKEKNWEEKAQDYMDEYRKAERTLIINFYTGGTRYSRGVLDSIYRGSNLLNP